LKIAPKGVSGISISWYNIGTTQIGKSPAIPPPIWKKPTPLAEFFGYQSAKRSCILFQISS
jgi:hypothetical protein